MLKNMLENIGYLAGVLTIISFVPQATKTWKTKGTKDLSWLTWIFLTLASIAWIGYGIALESLPMLVTNTVVMICSGLILLCKYKESRPPKPLKPREIRKGHRRDSGGMMVIDFRKKR